jgi:hypothetical protein
MCNRTGSHCIGKYGNKKIMAQITITVKSSRRKDLPYIMFEDNLGYLRLAIDKKKKNIHNYTVSICCMKAR